MANNNAQAPTASESLNIHEAFFLKYKKAIIIAVVAVIVIIAGVFGYISQISGPREDKASTMLGKGQTYFNNEMYEQALNGDGAGYVGFAKIANTAALTQVTWPTSMLVFAMPTSASGQRLRRAWTLSLLRATR